ncbi:MAG: phenylalanine--tRNA ligase subunit alpha [Candidatus Woesearchaeota archaeon]
MSQEVSLHEYEVAVLPLLQKQKSHQDVLKESGLTPVQISRAYQWLENKDFISLAYIEEESLTITRDMFAFRKILQSVTKGTYSLSELEKKTGYSQKVLLSQEGIIYLKKNGLCQLEKSDKGLHVVFTQTDLKKTPLEKFVETHVHKTVSFCELSEEEQAFVNKLRKTPGFIEQKKEKFPKITLTAKGKAVKVSTTKSQAIGQLTSTQLKEYTDSMEFRPYDVSAKVPHIVSGRVHPMTAVIRLIKDIFIEMGFSEMKGPWVETAFWCMDSMWIPQDHPARDVQDTFYLQKEGLLPKKDLVEKVKAVHEHGGKTGSTGYGYVWDPQKAKELVLRTHTTATTYRYLHEHVKKGPAKYFYVGKVFRNEAIDATHLPEFFQVEGFVMDDGLTIEHLLGFIKTFYQKLGYDKIKFKTTYNPYTEPSVEALYYDEKRGTWLELINSGIFRPESLAPYGITQPVIAWGLGLERLAMLLLEQGKLKDIIGPQSDLKWLRNYPVISRGEK